MKDYVGASGFCVVVESLSLLKPTLSELEGVLPFSMRNSDLII